MFKFLMFLALLACSSFFVTDAFSVEIELLKESDRLMESRGWSDPEKVPYQEQIRIIIDQTIPKNKMTVMLLSTDNEDFKLPKGMEDKLSEPRLVLLSFTNQFNCAGGFEPNLDDACVIIAIDREGLGDDLPTIKENSLKIADQMLADGFLGFYPEYHEFFLEATTGPNPDERQLIAKVTYTLKKHETHKLFSAYAPSMINIDIINSEGFYSVAEELAKNNFSEFALNFIPHEQGILRILAVSLVCTNNPDDRQTPYCLSENIDEQISRGDISPLEFFQLENISRSEIFAKEFLPLNSIIQVEIYSDQELAVKSVNSHVIEKIDDIGDVQDNGWFFLSKSGHYIDGRYIFGQESSVSKNGLAFSVGSYSGADVEIKEGDSAGGGCLIATSAFGSELAPQVQLLREIRDNTILQTKSGSTFMAGFNQFYYSFSPTIADYERENPVFKETVKLTLTPLLTSLTLLQYTEINSESEMLGYGISIILLNIGMYFVAPVILIMTIKKRICLNN